MKTDDIAPVREEYRNAVEELHAAADAVDGSAAALTEADDENREELQASLNQADEALSAAQTRANELRDRIELFERTAEARSIALPEAEEVEDEGEVRVGKEPLTYRRGGANSFFHDLYRRDHKHDRNAEERINRHLQEMEAEGKFDLSSTDAAGGQLIAPLYLQDEFVDRAAAARVVTDTIGVKPLPPNTDSINIPTLSTGTSVADQADNVAVSETDATFGTIAADVKTEAGLQDVSQQLVDRSVPGVDEVIFADLAKSYAIRIDTQVLNSSTSNNKGILQTTGINAVTYTDASPTVPELYSKVADAIQQIHTGVYIPPDAIFMHPRRWAWFLASLDTTNRPLVTPYAPQNAAAAQNGVTPQGAVGSLQGVDVFTDANIPTTLGSGTNEDRIIVAADDELYVWEDSSGPYLETFRDVGSGNLTVRFRLHNYWAQQHARRPKAISVVSGTGLATPTF
jgi:HK97 family phage major capsid protein